MEGPTRTCLACRQPATKPSLIRLAAIDGTVQVDTPAVLQARGAYVCATQECAEAALRREGAPIARALRIGREAVDPAAVRSSLAREINARTSPQGGRPATEQQRDDEGGGSPSRGVCT